MLSEFQVEVLRRQYQHSQLFVVIGSQTLLYTYVALRGVATWPQKAVRTEQSGHELHATCQPAGPRGQGWQSNRLTCSIQLDRHRVQSISRVSLRHPTRCVILTILTLLLYCNVCYM